MSDLSWLNPTPHAIAVYASRPLSPVATQHSLPSGRCPLLGRTSTGWIAPACLAHSFDHLVGNGEQRGRHGEADRPGSLGVDDKLQLARLHDRQVRRLRALEDAAGIAERATRTLLAHPSSTNSNLEPGKSLRSAESTQPKRAHGRTPTL